MYISYGNLHYNSTHPPTEPLQVQDCHDIPEPPLQVEQWLPQWIAHLRNAPSLPTIPPSASKIHTPLNPQCWQNYLATHPNQELVQFFLKGLVQGFRIGFNNSINSLHSARKNLQSATLHPEVVDQYLKEEQALSRVYGPYPKSVCSTMHISRFGVIPKSHQPNKWRLIIDLSHPQGHSVNDNIPKTLCSLSYITVDDAIEKILELGPHTLLAKVDIKSALRLLPVHPADRSLLAMQWNNSIYIDGCLPFGLRSAPKLFNIMADLLSWIGQHRGISQILHYLDDFLLIGPPSSPECQQNLNKFMQICTNLGVPLASEKMEGPATSLTFLGITLDTARMEIRFPPDKLLRIQESLSQWLGKRSATKREILSLVGLLQHATKVVRCGRTFVARMYATAAKVKELHFFTRLNRDFRSDIAWWHTFIQCWNGLSMLHHLQSPSHRFTIHTDASGSWGCGAFMNGQWLQWEWPREWAPQGIMAKELVPIVLSCITWGPQLAQQSVLILCDNLSLVNAIKKGSSKDIVVMQLLRCLWFFTAYFGITLTANHIPGACNTTADQLSRNCMSSFFTMNPNVSRVPAPLPTTTLQLLSPDGPDWTSLDFCKLFLATIPMKFHTIHPSL